MIVIVVSESPGQANQKSTVRILQRMIRGQVWPEPRVMKECFSDRDAHSKFEDVKIEEVGEDAAKLKKKKNSQDKRGWRGCSQGEEEK